MSETSPIPSAASVDADRMQYTGAPLRTIWFEPTATFRSLFTSRHALKYGVFWAALGGVGNVIYGAMRSERPEPDSILGGALLVGPIFALLGVFVYGSAVTLVGRWGGPKVSYRDVWIVQGWSQLPAAALFLFWLLPLARLAHPLPHRGGTGGEALAYGVTTLLNLGGQIWALVFGLCGLAAALRTTRWNAFCTSLLAFVALAVIVVPGYFLVRWMFTS